MADQQTTASLLFDSRRVTIVSADYWSAEKRNVYLVDESGLELWRIDVGAVDADLPASRIFKNSRGGLSFFDLKHACFDIDLETGRVLPGQISFRPITKFGPPSLIDFVPIHGPRGIENVVFTLGRHDMIGVFYDNEESLNNYYTASLKIVRRTEPSQTLFDIPGAGVNSSQWGMDYDSDERFLVLSRGFYRPPLATRAYVVIDLDTFSFGFREMEEHALEPVGRGRFRVTRNPLCESPLALCNSRIIDFNDCLRWHSAPEAPNFLELMFQDLQLPPPRT